MVKLYWIVAVIDSNSVLTKFRCWGVVDGKDRIHLNHPYMGKLDFDPAWGFSTRSIQAKPQNSGIKMRLKSTLQLTHSLGTIIWKMLERFAGVTWET